MADKKTAAQLLQEVEAAAAAARLKEAEQRARIHGRPSFFSGEGGGLSQNFLLTAERNAAFTAKPAGAEEDTDG